MPERENANENDAASTSETASSSSTSTTSETMNLFRKYEVGKLLGYGTFAKVYHAWNVCTGQSVVIKAVSKQKVLKGGFTAHVKREISIMRQLHHPHIVKLFEVLATKTKIYFVMEFAKGGKLFAKIVRGRFSEDLSRRYFQQLISAVGYCHSRGMFHRDLKPENLLLDGNWDLKVSDFGLSAVTDQIRPDGLLHTLCGMPAYVAPKILAKHATVFVLNSWVSWVNFCWVVVPIRVKVAVVGGSNLGLVRGLLRGLVCDLLVGLVIVIVPEFVACFRRGG